MQPNRIKAIKAFLHNINVMMILSFALRRNAPGLWALLEGEFLTIALASKDIRNLDDPKPMVELWYNVMKKMYHFTGERIWENRRQWMVPDVQISSG